MRKRKNKKKKGFTLLELLAVIIILAIIALIATPIIMRVISRVKESANERSIFNYVRTVEETLVAARTKGKSVANGTYEVDDNGNICLDGDVCEDLLIVEMSGNKPSGGKITIRDLKVTKVSRLCLDDKRYNYDNGDISIALDPGGYTASGDYISWDDLTSNSEYITLYNKEIQAVSQKFKNEITTLVIPEDAGITSIVGPVFYGCTSLRSVMLPSTLTRIGNFAFASTSLTSITIPEEVTSIGIWAFSGCTNLQSVTLPSALTSIGDSVFQNCTSLTSITIPEGVTSIGNHAFSGCTSLSSVTFNNQPSGTSWQVCTSADATSGTDVDITDAGINANNLRSNHRSEYWKRFGA